MSSSLFFQPERHNYATSTPQNGPYGPRTTRRTKRLSPCATTMPRVGVEPTWAEALGVLSPLRLPFRHPGVMLQKLEDPCRVSTTWMLSR